jgi:hypothetical protein
MTRNKNNINIGNAEPVNTALRDLISFENGQLDNQIGETPILLRCKKCGSFLQIRVDDAYTEMNKCPCESGLKAPISLVRIDHKCKVHVRGDERYECICQALMMAQLYWSQKVARGEIDRRREEVGVCYDLVPQTIVAANDQPGS